MAERPWVPVPFCALLPVLIMALAGEGVFGQERVRIVPREAAGSEKIPAGDYRVDSSLVLIPVHVTTPLGASVTTLSRDNFRMYEEEEEQNITVFANDDAPISIGLLFDASGSMKNKRQKVAEAAAAFFKTANKGDEFFLIEFNERAKLAIPFTPDAAEIYARIASTKPAGQTALLDAMHLALRQMRYAQNLRKAFVILSDGGDNWSRHSAHEVKNALLESDVQVYAMGVFDADLAIKHPQEERNGPELLDHFAGETGGRLYTVSDVSDLPSISERISRDLRSQYLLGYSPRHPARDGKYRRVQVKLSLPKEMPALRAYYRPGYFGN